MKVKTSQRAGINIRAETTKTIRIELSQDRAECIWHQLVEIAGIDISDDSECGDAADFLLALNEVLI